MISSIQETIQEDEDDDVRGLSTSARTADFELDDVLDTLDIAGGESSYFGKLIPFFKNRFFLHLTN